MIGSASEGKESGVRVRAFLGSIIKLDLSGSNGAQPKCCKRVKMGLNLGLGITCVACACILKD